MPLNVNGILTHPAWLASHSDAMDNHAIHRGNAIEMIRKLAASERVEQVSSVMCFASEGAAMNLACKGSGGSMKALLTSLLTSDAFLYRKIEDVNARQSVKCMLAKSVNEMDNTDSNIHRSRRQRFYQHLNEGEALVLFAGSAPRKSADACYPFFANRNFYYLTGILQADSVFLAVNDGGEIEETLFVHKKDPMAERWHGYRLSPEEAAGHSGVEQVKDLAVFDQSLKGVLEGGTVPALWYDFDKYDAGRADAPHNRHSASIRSAYPFVSFKNAYAAVCAARTIKDAEEISHIRDAMCITRDGIHAMMQAAKAGMHEYQLEAVFNKVLADAGVRESAFANIVSGGRNNFYIHYEEPTGILKDGDLILTDVGARRNGYVTDISRAFPVNGRFTTEQKEVYGIALQVNKELMELLVPGAVSFADIEAHARRRVGEKLVAAGYLGKDEDVSKYYWHKGTHHVGLDVHDVGPPGKPIAPGMVFTIDVGIYIEDRNIGFRVEDDVAITGTGYEHLSSEIVREIDDIEAMMS